MQVQTLPTSDPVVSVPADARIEISSFSAAVKAAIEAHETERAERVRAIKALHERDHYPVDTAKLANAMVWGALLPDAQNISAAHTISILRAGSTGK